MITYIYIHICSGVLLGGRTLPPALHGIAHGIKLLAFRAYCLLFFVSIEKFVNVIKAVFGKLLMFSCSTGLLRDYSTLRRLGTELQSLD